MKSKLIQTTISLLWDLLFCLVMAVGVLTFPISLLLTDIWSRKGRINLKFEKLKRMGQNEVKT